MPIWMTIGLFGGWAFLGLAAVFGVAAVVGLVLARDAARAERKWRDRGE